MFHCVIRVAIALPTATLGVKLPPREQGHLSRSFFRSYCKSTDSPCSIIVGKDSNYKEPSRAIDAKAGSLELSLRVVLL